MAESILFNVAGEIVSKLGSRLFRHIKLSTGVNTELEKLKNTVLTIQAVILDAEEKQSQSHGVRCWIESLKEVFYDVEDLLDELETDALRLQVMAGNKMVKEVRRFFSSSNKFAYEFKMNRKIKGVKDRLDGVMKNRGFHLEERQVETGHVMPREREQTHSSPPEVVIGRENDKEAIVKLLLSSNYEENVVVIPIVGMGGLGKTTLTQIVYNDKRIKPHFESRSWVCVSQDFDVKVIVEKILESITAEECRDLEMDPLKNHLHEKIDGKKYLLVLDDIWSDDAENWSRLRDLLVCGARGSRIIITTRLRKVAEIVSTYPPYELGVLSKLESWSLFKQMAFKRGEVPSRRHETIGQEIVRKCVGVPLAIKTIGRLLCFKNTIAEWESFKLKELSNVDMKHNDILRTLKLSYNHLPSHLKQCFAYCSLYPKGYKFNVKAMIHQWIAQGYIKSSDPSQCLEDVGWECFSDLWWRSFFQVVDSDSLGGPRYCSMHDLMHDLAKSVVGSENIILNSNMQCFGEEIRHASLNFDLDASWQVSNSLLKAQKLRTFFLAKNMGSKLTEDQCHTIFSNLRRLRILRLRDLRIERVPSSISKLKHIRFLDLSYNKVIEILPNSITELQNLQTLDLTKCERLKQLPEHMNKLVNLSELQIWGCTNLTHMPRGLDQLTSLLYLPTFVMAKEEGVSKRCGKLGELGGLNNLRSYLEILNLTYMKNNAAAASEFEAANLKEKQHLQVLVLAWKLGQFDDDKDDDVDDSAEILMSIEKLQPHLNLKRLAVYGCGRLQFPSWISSLTNLVDLQIYNCKHCRGFHRLDQFPSLKD